ncbi:MAG: HNH endonuclease [Desulfomonilaceae bacterium]
MKAFAKSWARGFCQFCGNIAQYEDAEGRPRLHVHHIQYLDQGGQDAVENVVAICPNCHDIIHLRQARADADILRAAVTNQLLNFA